MNPIEAIEKLKKANENFIPFNGQKIVVAPLRAVEVLLLAVDQLFPDNCEICKGKKGGVRGNENIVDGKTVCDYCS